MSTGVPEPARLRGDGRTMEPAQPAQTAATHAGGARIDVTPVRSRRDVTRFVRLPYRIYAADPNWVAPLEIDVRHLMDREKHPYHAHADTEFFLARRGDEVVGRIAATINHRYDEFHGEKAGFFGLFESVDDTTVAGALLETAESWLRARGAAYARGPMNLSTNDELYSPGVLVDGFDTPPFIMMGHSPRYYPRLLEAAGYGDAKNLVAYYLNQPAPPERYVQAMDKVRARSGLTVRSLNMKDFAAELQRVQDIYNSAWEDNWAFVPLTDAEVAHMAKQLKPVINPRLCILVEDGDTPVGFGLCVPDYNVALRHARGRLLPFGLLKMLWHRRRIRQARVITLGLRPGYRNRGLMAMIMVHMYNELPAVNMARGECGWILEDNWEMRRGIDRVGGQLYKTYRVYQKSLGA
jgi:GNAT superfamily N-acetyltransferase